MHGIFTFLGSMWQLKLHVLNLYIHRAGPLYSPVKWLWSQTFLSADLNPLLQIEQFVLFLYSFYCSRVSRFMGILLARFGLQMVAAARAWSESFQRSHPPYSFGVIQSTTHAAFHVDEFLHGTWFWYWVVKHFDNDFHMSLVNMTCFTLLYCFNTSLPKSFTNT